MACKWYPQDLVTTKSAANRMATNHKKNGYATRIRRVVMPTISSKTGRVKKNVRYWVDIKV